MNNEEAEPNFEVNAIYQAKTITINLGLTLPPQFKASYPLPVKYGGLGFVIAHQLLHAFDPDVLAEEAETDGSADTTNTFFETESRKRIRTTSKLRHTTIREIL